jgi:capsid protein
MTQAKVRKKAAKKAGVRQRRRVRKSVEKVANRFSRSLGRVMNLERAALLAGDIELAAAMKMVTGNALTNSQERTVATRSGMFGNVFAARFDSAQTTADNAAHWGQADGLAADAAANPMIRYILRNRARYEAANNSYCRGMVETLATDCIGTGPRLLMMTGDDAADEWVVTEFMRWCRVIRSAEKLRTMCKAKTTDGEAFGLMISNPGLPTPVKLDLRTIEADQVRFVDITLLTVPSVDGIRFDDFGNPVSYHVLRVHPGFWSYATGYIGFPWEYDVWPAKFVLHWFRQDRAGQHRGIPEIMPALPLFAQLRRYTLAALQAAETAADFALFMHTPTAADAVADEEEVIEVPNPFDLFPLQRNIVTTLPDGYTIDQTKAEQPTTTHEMFVRTILREIARCLNMPYNVAAGDSSDSSFSSGRLDHQVYFRTIAQAHKDVEYGIMDRLLAAWLREASYATIGNGDFGTPYMPTNVRKALGVLTGEAADLPEHTYNWVEHEWGNPAQAATATDVSLRNGSTTYAIEYAKKGTDYRKAHQAQAKALGISLEEYQKLLRGALFTPRGAVARKEAPPEPGVPEPKPTSNRKPAAVGADAT